MGQRDKNQDTKTVLASASDEITNIDTLGVNLNRLANRVLITFSILSVPILVLSLLRAVNIGWQPLMTAQIVIYLLLLVTALYRRKLAFCLRVTVLLTFPFLIGIGGFISFGFASPGIVAFMCASVLAVTFLGKRAGNGFVVLCFFITAAIGVSVYTGYITYGLDFNIYLTNPIAWSLISFGVIMFMGVGVVTQGSLRDSLIEDTKTLKMQNSALAEANTRLTFEIDRRKKAELDSGKSHYLLQTLIDTIEGEVFVKDTNGKYLFLNKAFENDFGVNMNDAIGKDDFFIFSREVAEQLQEADKRIITSKTAETVEESGEMKGKQVTYISNKVPLINDEGNVYGVCGIGFDITKQKRLEKELQKTVKDLQIITDNVPAFIAYVDKDQIFRFTNRQYREAVGYSNEEIHGSTVKETLTKKGYEKVQHHIEKVLSGQRVEFEAFIPFEGGITRCLNAIYVPYFKKETVDGFFALIIDITGRKKAENSLRENRKDWERTVDAIDDWITLIDLDSNILRSNLAVEAFFQIKVQDAIGLKCCKLAHGTETPIIGCPLPKMLQTKKRESVEVEMENGQWISVTVDPIFNSAGKMTSAVHIVTDITKRITIRNERKGLITELKDALSHVKTLGGLIPICAHCKKIRDDKGYWNILESYIQKHSDASFSHSMCPECSDELYGNEDWYIEMKKDQEEE